MVYGAYIFYVSSIPNSVAAHIDNIVRQERFFSQPLRQSKRDRPEPVVHLLLQRPRQTQPAAHLKHAPRRSIQTIGHEEDLNVTIDT